MQELLVTPALDKSQELAVAAVSEWIDRRMRNPREPQIFRLGGSAGSGKSTVIREVCERNSELDIIVVTLAGKAASVLRGKGLEKATNLHQVIYAPNREVQQARARIFDAMRETQDANERRVLLEQLEQTRLQMFARRESLEADLIVVDESSMIDGRMTEDMRRYGKPILAVGDPNQLPPIETVHPDARPLFSVPDEADCWLTGNHRSGGAELLTMAAAAALDGQAIPVSLMIEHPDVAAYDVILVWRKTVREQYIKLRREALKRPLDRPVPGDVLMVWFNDPGREVFNGTIFTVAEIDEGGEGHDDAWFIQTDTGDSRYCYKDGFIDTDSLERLGRINPKVRTAVVASFGDVLTVHKAQGSEWPRVLVVDHPSGSRMSNLEKKRWRYTAITRARDVIHVHGEGFGSSL